MERISKFRATIVLLLFVAILGFFAFKLYDLQIIETGGSTNNQATFTTLTRVKASRGHILDINGNPLVSNRASYDLIINHYVLLTANGTNDNLLRLVKRCEEAGIEYTEHFPISQERPFTYTLDQQNAIWQDRFQVYLEWMEGLDSDITAPLLVEKLRERYKIPAEWTDDEARKVIGLLYEMSLRKCIGSLPTYVFISDASDEELSAIVELNIPGMKVEASTVREYSTKYASHILGYVGAMSAEQWEYYKNIEGYDMDAQVGQDGLEAAYEEFLHGVDGWREDTVTTDGTLVSSKYLQEPKAGSNVEVSIDLGIQSAAEDTMAQVIADLQKPDEKGNLKDGHDVEGGAFVAMDVRTGQLLACGSYPTYDLTTFFDNYEELAKNELKPLYNRALLATYPPGSTYKMNMVIAAMDSGLIDGETTIYDGGKFRKYQGYQPTCLAYTDYGSSHGTIDASEALKVSCNYFFYELGDRLSLSAMDSTAKHLGLGEPTGIELPEEIGYRKVFDILRSGGAFARFANHPHPDKERTQLTEEIDQLYEEYYNGFHKRSKGKPVPYTEEAARTRAQIAEKYGFTDIRWALFYRTRTFTASQYIQLLGTYSDHIAIDAPTRNRFFSAIEAAINRHGGLFPLYDTIDLQLARKP